MKKNCILLILMFQVTMLLVSCRSSQDVSESSGTLQPALNHDAVTAVGGGTKSPVAMVAPVVIYKTRGNYNNLVPVRLDNSGSRIVSYPAPSDLIRNGKYATPVELADGYLWDRRGVSANSVFTDYTYDVYASMPSAPSVDEILKHVKYRKPFEEMYIVEGMRNPSVEQLNELINNGFKGCKVVIKAK